MFPQNNVQTPIFSYKQICLPQSTWNQQYDFTSTSNYDSYSIGQSQSSPTTEQQKSRSYNCLGQLKQEVDTIIPKKQSKGQGRPFSRLEDELILHLVDQFGPKFRKFVKFFSGRQATILKNRFYKSLRQEYLTDKVEAARKKEKTTKEKEIRNTNQTKKNPFIDQQLQIQECLKQSELTKEAESIMGRCVDNLFTIFQNMYQ